jgi:hypothetical protein
MDAVTQAMQAAAPDTVVLRRHFQAAHQAMGNAHWLGLRAAGLAKAALTEEQRRQVSAWADEMEMHGGMGERPPEAHERY